MMGSVGESRQCIANKLMEKVTNMWRVGKVGKVMMSSLALYLLTIDALLRTRRKHDNVQCLESGGVDMYLQCLVHYDN